MSTNESDPQPGPSNRDINEVFDEIVNTEERVTKQGYEQGLAEGKLVGSNEGYHLGYHRGAEIGAELGYYYGVMQVIAKKPENPERIQTLAELILQLIDEYPRHNDETVDVFKLADNIRSNYRKVCSLLKISGRYVEEKDEDLTF